MRQKIWKKLLVAGCAMSLLVTAPGMTILADQLQEDEVIVTEAEDPGDDVINENEAEQSEDVLEESTVDVINLEECTEPVYIEEEIVDSVDDTETVGSVEYTVGDGVTATFDTATGEIVIYSAGGTLWKNWLRQFDKSSIQSIKLAENCDSVFLPADSTEMFYSCSNLRHLDLRGFDTSNVTDMESMFCDCRCLTNLDLSSFDTLNVTDMRYMFYNCSRLANLDLSSFDTSNVTNMRWMFSRCSSLTNLDLSSFDTSKVTDMESMFLGCDSLTNLDLSSFDMSNLDNYVYFLRDCDELSILKTPKKNNKPVELSSRMIDETNNEYIVLPAISQSITLTKMTVYENVPVGENVTATFDETKGTVEFYSEDGTLWKDWIKQAGFVSRHIQSIRVASGTVYLPEDSSFIFSIPKLSEIDVSGIDTSNVTDMGGMFYGCSSLTNLDLSSFNTSNVTDMSGMFEGCSSLTNLDLSSFDTSNVTDMIWMFDGCSSLTNLDLSSFDTSKLEKDYGYFHVLYCCDSLSVLNTPKKNSFIIDLPFTMYDETGNEYTSLPVLSKSIILTKDKPDSAIHNISDCTVNLETQSYTYDGKEKKPTVTVNYRTAALLLGTDYSVTYSNNTNAGIATVKVVGIGNYQGEQTVTFSIEKAMPKLTFASGSVNKTTLDGAFTNKLTKTTDGTVTFKSSNTKVATVSSTSGKVTIKGEGTATITVTAAEGTNYKSGSAKYTLTVVDGRTDVSGLAVSLSATSYTYDGKAKEPAVTVKNGDTTLTSGTDYTVSYSDNTNAGTATAKVTGAGKYKGEKSVTFTINKAEAKLSFAENAMTKKITDAAFTNTLTKTTDGTVTFKSGNTKVATVDSASGLVTIKGAGTATITASSTEGKNYKAGSASYILTAEAPATPTPKPTVSGFSDVQDPSHAFYKAIYWAADAGITKGYPDGTFGIDRSCTRGEMIMFLWRYAGKPAAKALSKSPFKDVPKTHAFYSAIIWASQKGITKGYPDGTFGINRNVSRGECMMFLWRLRGKPAPKAVSVSPFKDVPKTHAFYNAILWGAQKKITNGYTSGPKKGTFGINENCTRGAIVTFLYRAR